MPTLGQPRGVAPTVYSMGGAPCPPDRNDRRPPLGNHGVSPVRRILFVIGGDRWVMITVQKIQLAQEGIQPEVG